MPVSPELLQLIRCPKCRGTLTPQTLPSGDDALACEACRLRYAVVDGIPQLLVEEAQAIGA